MMYGYTSVIRGFGILENVILLVILIDLILVGILLWKRINSETVIKNRDKTENEASH